MVSELDQDAFPRNLFKIFRPLTERKDASLAEETLSALASAITHRLDLVDDAGFFLITTKKGAWTEDKSLSGVSIAAITKREKQANAKWDAEQLRYEISESDMEDGQVAVLFLPGVFECIDIEKEKLLTEKFKSEIATGDNSLFDLVVEDDELYKREEWKVKKLHAVVAQKRGRTLYTMHIYSGEGDNDTFIAQLSNCQFKNGKAQIGSEIYLTSRQATEKQMFNERHGKLLVLRPSTEEELKGGV